MFCCYLSKACAFLTTDRKGVDLERRRVGGLGGVEGGVTNQDIVYEK